MKNDLVSGFADATAVMADGDVVKREVPGTFSLLKFGKNKYTIDGEDGTFDLDAVAANDIVDEFNKRAKDLVVDYEHGTLKKDSAVKGESPAAGWIKKLALTPEGIVAADVSWTDKANSMLQNGEIRYHSPVIQFDKKTHKPKAIQSVALTTHPAIHGSPALVAASDISISQSNRTEEEMATIKELNDFGAEVAKNIGDLRVVFGKVCEELRSRATTDAEVKMFSDTENKLKLAAFGDAAIVLAKPINEVIKVKTEVDGTIDKAKVIEMLVATKVDATKIAEVTRLIDEHNALILKEKQAEVPIVDSDDDAGSLDSPENKTSIETEASGTDSIGTDDDSAVLDEKQMSDTDKAVMSMLGLSDLGDMDKIKDSIQALSDFKINTEKVLAAQKVKTPDELVMKIVTVEQSLAKKDQEVRDAIALHDAQTAVDKAVMDGALTESHREWAVEFAKKDMKAFSDFVKGVPTALKAPGTIALADKSISKNTVADGKGKRGKAPAAFIEVAKKMKGMSDEEAEQHYSDTLKLDDTTPATTDWNTGLKRDYGEWKPENVVGKGDGERIKKRKSTGSGSFDS